MENDTELRDKVFKSDDSSYYKKINPITVPKKDIGIDTDKSIINNVIDANLASVLDLSQLESFLTISNSREQVYELIDTMSEDPIIAAALETYAEDATETNEFGRSVWCESEDPNVVKFVTYLLDSMKVEKNIYRWVYSLCKYGDCYLKLYRESEIVDDLFSNLDQDSNGDADSSISLQEKVDYAILKNAAESSKLDEDLILKAYSKKDKFVHYLEMVPNPAEMFELTKYGKSYAYVKANIPVHSARYDDVLMNTRFRYNFRKRDIELHTATDYVHAVLEDNSSRVPELVSIYRTDADYDSDLNAMSYTVRRGQSLLYNLFKIWRELTLLENSLMLNRLTKSSIVRIVSVEVGDMPREEVTPLLQSYKSLIEQKSAFNVGESINEYLNPGPIENTVYVSTRGGKGDISINSIGGDVDIKGLADLDYFKNKLYAGLRIPKQYLGDTDDATGFNGGTALSLTSSRYAKTIKRIQNTIVQALTDAVNLMLLDKGLQSYINKFELHMQAPTTQEEVDRLSNVGNEVNYYNDIIGLLSDIKDSSARLTIAKTLLSNVVSDSTVLGVVEDQIKKLKSDERAEEKQMNAEGEGFDFGDGSEDSFDLSGQDFGSSDADLSMPSDFSDTSSGGELPLPSDVGVDIGGDTGEEL